jgi:hypothetical protein
MMDAELHRVPDVVGEIQDALLPVRTVGMDIPHHDVRSLLDPQQLCL